MIFLCLINCIYLDNQYVQLDKVLLFNISIQCQNPGSLEMILTFFPCKTG